MGNNDLSFYDRIVDVLARTRSQRVWHHRSLRQGTRRQATCGTYGAPRHGATLWLA